MAPVLPDDASAAGNSVRHGTRMAPHRHGGRALLVLAGILLPLWGFAELAGQVQARETLAFDARILLAAHSVANATLDRVFLLVSAAGYGYGAIPGAIALVVALALMRRLREATFAFFALGGSLLLNALVKQWFSRARPALWESIAPHYTYSFPSGHAMASATLGAVLVLLTWRTRWRWPVLALALAFVLLVGVSRVYLGVHYPSDILAGWAVASIWTATVYLAVFRLSRRPWHPA